MDGELYRRPNFGRLEVEVTLHDPAIYANPLEVTLTAQLMADTELLEYVCNENTKPRDHWVGRLSDIERSEIEIPADVLAEYAGRYVEQRPYWSSTRGSDLRYHVF